MKETDLDVLYSALADLIFYVIELSASVDALAELTIANAPDPAAAQKNYSESRARLQKAAKQSALPRWQALRKRKKKS